MPKVSVIVPIYNVEPFLKQCIDSILAQTLKDIEIILVDDGSTDGSGRICDEYADISEKIIVIHKLHEGLSIARNTGICIASASYIMFVDSDDWVEPSFCELPYYIADRSNIDLVLFTYNKIKHTKKKEQVKCEIRTGVISEIDAIEYCVCFAPYAWLGLYRRSLFDQIIYPEQKYYEDLGTSHKLVHSANKRYFINEPLYNHRVGRTDSITLTMDRKNHPDKREMITVRINDLAKWGYDAYSQFDAFSMLILFGVSHPDQRFFIEILKDIDNPPTCFSKKRRMLFRTYKTSIFLFDIICFITGKRIK